MEKIVFHRIGLCTTFRCTLKCELCCAYAPYFSTPPHYSLQEITDLVARVFEIVDFIEIFSITGGESLLHENLPDIVDFVNQYRSRIGRLEVITNGTLVPNERLIQRMKASNARFLVDDYGPALSVKADEIEALLKKHGATYERRYNGNTEKGAHCGGWVDLVHFSDEPASQHEAENLFSRCLNANELRCNPVIDGKIYLCPPYEFCVRNGRIEEDPRFCIDLTDKTQSIESLREKAREFLKINVLPSCVYCNGWLPESKRYVPARQIKSPK